jgi:hypothetical protein
LGVEFVDTPITPAQLAPIRFTFFWPNSNSWEGRNYVVQVENKRQRERGKRAAGKSF